MCNCVIGRPVNRLLSEISYQNNPRAREFPRTRDGRFLVIGPPVLLSVRTRTMLLKNRPTDSLFKVFILIVFKTSTFPGCRKLTLTNNDLSYCFVSGAALSRISTFLKPSDPVTSGSLSFTMDSTKSSISPS